ncbi:MAG: FimB/Mfa2 family fimbrial subunit [Phocaeicola sp.]
MEVVKKKQIRKWRSVILLVCFAILLFSCQKFEEIEPVVTVETAQLSVSARSIGTVEVPYPVLIYAFSDDGNCISKQEVASASESLKMELPLGRYQLIALAGTTDEYLLSDAPTLSDALRMAEGIASQAAMMGRVHVTLTNKSASLEITLNYVVAAFKASFSGIAEGVSSLSVYLSPLYGSLLLNGDYSAGGELTEVVCKNEGDGVWSCDSHYIFPCSGQKMAFSISIQEMGGAIKSYGYQTSVLPQANHPYVIHGSYQDGTLEVGGGLVAEGWGEPIYVDFDFGPNIPEGDDEEIEIAGIPEVGAIWNDCIVVNVSNQTSKGANLVLLSIDEWEIYRSEIDECLASCSISTIGGWRAPTYEEAGWLNQQIRGEMVAKINSAIIARGKKEYLLNDDERYLCDKDGVIYSFAFAAGKNRAVTGDGRTYLFRAVTEYVLVLP